jgi:5-methyltetrahydropteroyltriglutamate--homocysteine methyltransferase
MEMTKWFDTNYHYIVPELEPGQRLGLTSRTLTDDVRLALEHGHRPKAVLLGPVTFLALAKGMDGQDPWARLDEVLGAYAALLAELDGLCPWIQIDEPILCTDLPAQARAAFPRACAALNGAVGRSGLLLAAYFGALDGPGLDLALASGCRGLHVDLVRGARSLPALLDRCPRAWCSRRVLWTGAASGVRTCAGPWPCLRTRPAAGGPRG